MAIHGECPSRPVLSPSTTDRTGLWAAVASRCPRPVTVLSATAGDDVHVITAATFGVVSVEPPLVSVTVGASGRTCALIEAGGGFAVSLLSSGQEPVARTCALPARRTWTDLPAVAWEPGPATGAPVLRDAPAWLDCRVHSIVHLADQALVVGWVEHAGTGPDAAPLLRFDGAYHPLLTAGSLWTRRGGDQT